MVGGRRCIPTQRRTRSPDTRNSILFRCIRCDHQIILCATNLQRDGHADKRIDFRQRIAGQNAIT
ncbi:hypothetical protein ACOFFC_004616 [Klebsiella oxytoca]